MQKLVGWKLSRHTGTSRQARPTTSTAKITGSLQIQLEWHPCEEFHLMFLLFAQQYAQS
jgi:hypothetical protein